MKTKTICSFFLLSVIVAGLITTTPTAFADHPEVTIETGSVPLSIPGCEETNECYTPYEAVIDAGYDITVTNTDATALHTFTSGTVDGFTASPDGKFDTGFMLANNTMTLGTSELEPGEYPYYCTLHVWMVGKIIVQEAQAETGDGHDADGDMMKDADGHDADGDMMKDADGHDADGDMMKDADGDMMKDADGDMMMMDDGVISATAMLSDETMISVKTTEAAADTPMKISIEFKDSEHVNFDMVVTQNGDEVLNESGAHHHDGKATFDTAPLKSDEGVDITITFQGYGVPGEPRTGPIFEPVLFSNIVPEFGGIAMMILAVAIISMVAITAKSKIVPRI